MFWGTISLQYHRVDVDQGKFSKALPEQASPSSPWAIAVRMGGTRRRAGAGAVLKQE